MTVGATVSSTIVSLLVADQLPAVSFHWTYTRRVPFVAGRVQACEAAYGRMVQVVAVVGQPDLAQRRSPRRSPRTASVTTLVLAYVAPEAMATVPAGATESSRIVSDFGADQLPAASFHLT